MLKMPIDEVELAAIDAGAEDVKESDNDLTIICEPGNLENLKKSLELLKGNCFIITTPTLITSTT